MSEYYCARLLRFSALVFAAVFVVAFHGANQAYCAESSTNIAALSAYEDADFYDDDYGYEDEEWHDISEAIVSAVPTQYLDDNTQYVSVHPIVTLNGATLTEGEDKGYGDYWITYEGIPRPGKVTATIHGDGYYEGTKTFSFNVVGKLSRLTVNCYDASKRESNSGFESEVADSLKGYDYDVFEDAYANEAYYYYIKDRAYTGAAIQPQPTVEFVTYDVEDDFAYLTTLEKGKDYTLSFGNNVNVGTATITVKGIGSYTGSFTKTFKIKGNLSNAIMSSIPDRTYTGEAITPKPTVKFFGKALSSGVDYDLSYKNNRKAGTATVTAKGKGSYTGSVSATFEIRYSLADKKKVSISVDDMEYTGKAVKPKLEVKYGKKVLERGVDYTVSYEQNVKSGKAAVIITGKGSYMGTAREGFWILYPLSKAKIAHIGSKTYTGKAIKPKPSITYGGKKLKLGRDYRLYYDDNKTVGTAMVTAEGIGKYSGDISAKFKIKCPMNNKKIDIEVEDALYTGKAVKPQLAAWSDLGRNGSFNLLKKGVDYAVKYKNNKKAGLATAIVIGKGLYTGTAIAKFHIKYPISKAKITVSKKVAYTGVAIEPKPTIKYRGKKLKLGRDYRLYYDDNKKVGTAIVTAEGIGKYDGDISAKFKIYRIPISKARVGKIKDQTLSGSSFEVEPKPVVKYGKKTLKRNKDYTLSYKGNRTFGKATVTIEGKGSYTGSVKKTFKVIGYLKDADVPDMRVEVSTGNALTPKPKRVEIGGTSLREGRDYTLSYEGNVEPGTASVIITGKGYFKGKKAVTFRIVQQGWGGGISLDEFNRIEMDMTYSQVCAVIGGKGKLSSSYSSYESYYESYEWEGDPLYSSAYVHFEDGKVVHKSQYGL